MSAAKGRVRPAELPAQALLQACRESGAFTDCYATELASSHSHADFVAAFYSTSLFKLERWLIACLLKRPASDADARALGAGRLEHFAAWRVEGRATDQLLLCDIAGRTRSWLMVEPLSEGRGTRLLFGSAVVPHVDKATGQASMGWMFSALLGFHKLYSRALLASAARRLEAAS
ncbi:hypothetical protein [Pelomonas sp. SE-A7]|uniref:hypothetical protein n=1 Tax=Pelomonas sp. SE-A7 TaxID=3054953 RepID=UPI00259D1F87|nr:hypothetical protein [Pelomonas sp. SE-A7]MDM4764752.1 hypothetical protein [Pelomonas sp. SE-A7]